MNDSDLKNPALRQIWIDTKNAHYMSFVPESVRKDRSDSDYQIFMDSPDHYIRMKSEHPYITDRNLGLPPGYSTWPEQWFPGVIGRFDREDNWEALTDLLTDLIFWMNVMRTEATPEHQATFDNVIVWLQEELFYAWGLETGNPEDQVQYRPVRQYTYEEAVRELDTLHLIPRKITFLRSLCLQLRHPTYTVDSRGFVKSVPRHPISPNEAYLLQRRLNDYETNLEEHLRSEPSFLPNDVAGDSQLRPLKWLGSWADLAYVMDCLIAVGLLAGTDEEIVSHIERSGTTTVNRATTYRQSRTKKGYMKEGRSPKLLQLIEALNQGNPRNSST